MSVPDRCADPSLLRRNVSSVFGGFELSLRRHTEGYPDPLTVARFTSWGSPLPCLPMIWVYGSPVAMPMAVPNVMIELPVPDNRALLRKQVNDTGWSAVVDVLSELADQAIELWALVHTAPSRAPCQKASHDMAGEQSLDEVNLAHHVWIRPDLDIALAAEPNLSIVTSIRTGIFGATGVEPIHQDLACVKSRGLPFGMLDQREVIIHDTGRFSPCNNMLRLESGKQLWHHFFSCSICDGASGPRAAVVLHIIPGTKEVEHRFGDLVQASQTLADVCAALAAVDEASGRALLTFLLPACGQALSAAVAPRQARLSSELSQLPALDPWRSPSVAAGTARPGAGFEAEKDLLALASRMMELGYANFDLNLEVLQMTGGDVEEAVAFLGVA